MQATQTYENEKIDYSSIHTEFYQVSQPGSLGDEEI